MITKLTFRQSDKDKNHSKFCEMAGDLVLCFACTTPGGNPNTLPRIYNQVEYDCETLIVECADGFEEMAVDIFRERYQILSEDANSINFKLETANFQDV